MINDLAIECDMHIEKAIEKIKKNIVGKKIILYGSGKLAEQTIILLKNIVPDYVVDDEDSSEVKEHVYPLEKLQKEDENKIVIIIAKADFYTSREKIQNIFQNNNMDNIYISFADWVFAIKEDLKIIEKLFNCLADEYSQNVFKGILFSRLDRALISSSFYRKMISLRNYLMGDKDDPFERFPHLYFLPKKMDIDPYENQYFKTGLLEFSDQEVYVDAGAFDGDTIVDFIKAVDDKYKRIYAFEPDRTIFKKIKENIVTATPECVCLYNMGVAEKEAKLSFSNQSSLGSCFSSTGDEFIEVKSLDNTIHEAVTFIKMDIEGYEGKALQGAKNILQKDQPKLAICLYHKPTDLWEIPLLVQTINPRYKLYIRHHSPFGYESILYAHI